MVLNCIGADIEMTFANKKAIITKGKSQWSYDIPYTAEKQNEWIKDNTGWWYNFADGNWAKGWERLPWSGGTNEFYFNNNGYMVTGWQKLQKNEIEGWFYFDVNTGCMLTGWQKLQWLGGVDWFYFDEGGFMLTDWQELEWSGGVDKFYFDKVNGNMKTGWILDEIHWFFLDKITGAMKKGWVFDNNYWYWLDKETGIMATGWLKENGKTYYLEPNPTLNQGHAYQNTVVTIDG